MNRIMDKGMKVMIFFLAGVIVLSSCIKEDIDSCKVKVRFSYHYNILSSDALEEQADQIMLYLFDKQGFLVNQWDISKEQSFSNFRDLEMDAPTSGQYRFVAWAKSNALSKPEADFQIPTLTVGSSKIEDLSYQLKTTNNVIAQELNHFLVGMSVADIDEIGGDQTVEISLKKVTKKIRVVILPYAPNSRPIDVNDYAFSIYDVKGNGHVNYDYQLLPGTPVIYQPYYKSNIKPAPGESPLPGEINQAVAVEFSISRLLETNDTRLLITTKDGDREIVNIHLPWLFSLTKMESHQDWDLQEYLDRLDEYAVTLYFNDSQWVNSFIVINGWVVNINNID